MKQYNTKPVMFGSRGGLRPRGVHGVASEDMNLEIHSLRGELSYYYAPWDADYLV